MKDRSMKDRSMKDRFDGTGPMIFGAAFFWVIGSVFLVIALTSPTRVQWTGSSVQGTEQGGIVYYTVHGRSYSLDATSRFMSHTVYFDPSDPGSTAMLGSTVDRVIDLVSVGAPYLLAVGIVGSGVGRRRRRRRQRRRLALSGEAQFGRGLDQELVQRLLEEHRRGPSEALEADRPTGSGTSGSG